MFPKNYYFLNVNSSNWWYFRVTGVSRILAATVALSRQNAFENSMHLCYIYFIVEILKGLKNRSI